MYTALVLPLRPAGVWLLAPVRDSTVREGELFGTKVWVTTLGSGGTLMSRGLKRVVLDRLALDVALGVHVNMGAVAEALTSELLGYLCQFRGDRRKISARL